MLNLPNGKVTVAQLLMPVSLISFVLFIMLAFQLTQVLRDRQSMHDALMQQQKPLEEAGRVQDQLNALAVGTQNLAEKGDKGAKAIIDRMNKLGIKVNPNAQAAPRPPMGRTSSAMPSQPMAPPGAAPVNR